MRRSSLRGARMPEPQVYKEVDDDALMALVITEDGSLEFAAVIEQQGDTLYLRKLHIYGGGPNTMGLRAIRRYIQQVAISLDVKTVIIEGGERVTGAAAGEKGTGPRMPKRLTFHREEP